MTFENAKAQWESNDGWQFADRKAERKFFYQEGMRRAKEVVTRLEDNLNAEKFRTCERCVEKTAKRCAEIAAKYRGESLDKVHNSSEGISIAIEKEFGL